MMTVLATIAAVIFVAAGCYILLRDLYNIVEALASGVTFAPRTEARGAGKVELKNVYAAR